MKVLLLGSGAREAVMAEKLKDASLYCMAAATNPQIKAWCQDYFCGDFTDPEAVVAMAQQIAADMVVIGPEAPLEKGVADQLIAAGFAVVGPRQALAQVETSKAFARTLMQDHSVPGGAQFKTFDGLTGVSDYLATLGEAYVIKANGLMGGKGVKVGGEHLANHQEALAFCEEVFAKKQSVVIEEKFVGQEFSLFTFTDGVSFIHSPTVQDHKRAYEGDTGPNTGGMGCYATGARLPFLSEEDVVAAKEINERMIAALNAHCGAPYQGILYGGFMATASGVKVIEFNARLGDPEAMCVLNMLQSDFVSMCHGMATQTLGDVPAHFSEQVTVCKYAVPNGYPESPIKGEPLIVHSMEGVYLAAVDERHDQLIETGSRTFASIGVGASLAEAELLAEQRMSQVQGPLFHRKDIGTQALIDKRVLHMASLRGDRAHGEN